ncbi:MAG: hypothetical protein JWP63_1300 [Candidatus Solibacter sp.]|jgi:uncharacterized protein (DUF885 family)|nr:hypothetical protein [Candidatus Solibacter sp.]
MAKLAAILLVLTLAVGCGKNSAKKLGDISEEFVLGSLAFSPSAATSAGLHEYQGQKLDEMLDDNSPANLARQNRFYEKIKDRLSSLKQEDLTPEDRADLTIMQDQIALTLLDFNEIHTSMHSPQSYVETLGNALFTPFVLEYAPKAERVKHIMARLQKVPLFLDQASTNMVSAPPEWTQVAIDENQGNMNLVDKEIRAGIPADQAQAYAQVARPALDAMIKFDKFLKTSMPGRSNYSWRLGGAIYPRKFRYSMDAGVEPDSTLQDAERELGQVRARMLQLALPLHREMFAVHKDHADLSGAELENAVIGEVLGRIAERHSARENYMDDARKDLEEARGFVKEKHLLTLPARSNLQVIPTPEYMRGAYAVGGFNPAPALQPQLGAFYWITPISPSWSKERVESKLREYNFFKLKLLTIHEAMPGHYVQMEIANEIQPQGRRLVRSVFGNGAYIEGWAQYATQMMLDEGFLNHSPEMALTFAKEELRVIANTILDVRLQMLNMSDKEALDLMEKQTFQEEEEATAKLQRAKLSSAQLPMYFVGWRSWIRLRDEYKQAKGSAYSLPEFNDRALKEGAVPFVALKTLLK